MPMVTPTLNLPQPATPPAAPKPAALPVAAPVPTAVLPSTTVTLSPQASAMAASHSPSQSSPSTSTAPSTSAPAAPVPHDSSLYDSLKSGIANAVGDVEDVITGGAHAIVDGVETALSTANKVATGIVELPFAAVAKACDAVGAVIDDL